MHPTELKSFFWTSKRDEVYFERFAIWCLARRNLSGEKTTSFFHWERHFSLEEYHAFPEAPVILPYRNLLWLLLRQFKPIMPCQRVGGQNRMSTLSRLPRTVKRFEQTAFHAQQVYSVTSFLRAMWRGITAFSFGVNIGGFRCFLVVSNGMLDNLMHIWVHTKCLLQNINWRRSTFCICWR